MFRQFEPASDYHPQWHAVRKDTKFHRLAEFGQALPRIRRRVGRDLRLRGLPRQKVVAAVVWLLEETHIRIGNPEYADENESFGLSTMRNRHELAVALGNRSEQISASWRFGAVSTL